MTAGGRVGTEDLLAVADAAVSAALPGESVEVYAVRSRGTEVKVHDARIESLTDADTQGVGIRVIRDGRTGFSHSSTLAVDEAMVVLADARENCRFAEPDVDAALAEPDGVAVPGHDLVSDDVHTMAPAEKAELAFELERLVVGTDPRVSRTRTVGYADTQSAAALVSTSGVRVADTATAAYLSAVAIANDAGDTAVGYHSSAARGPGGLDPAGTAAVAVDRATRILHGRKPASRRTTIVLEPRLAATFLGIVGGMVSGERVLKGRTPFAGRIGDVVASPLLTLVEDPTEALSLGASNVDSEGLACRRTPLLTAGVLQGFLHNAYTARRLGAVPTASAVRGLKGTPGVGARCIAMVPGDEDDPVASVDDGVFVQTLAGLHSGVNPVSGDFSVGMDGIRITNGVLAEPIREATIASSLQRMLTDIRSVGADLTWLPGGTGACTIVIDGVSLGGD